MKKAGFVLFGIFILFFCVSLASGAVLNVCPTCNYTKIQDAINNATAGDTINVSAGSYNERLMINKSGLVIQGAGTTNTIINLGQPSETTGIWIIADNVQFKRFRVINISTISSHAQYAIRIRGSNNMISDNIIVGQSSRDWWTDEEDSGINIDGTSTIISERNIVENNEIYDFSAMGVQVVNSGNYNTRNNTVRDNYIHDIDYYSIVIDRSANNIIQNNNLSNIGPSEHGGDGYPATGIIVWGSQAAGTLINDQNISEIEVGIVLSAANNIIINSSKINNNGIGIKLTKSSWLTGKVEDNIIKDNIITNNDLGILVSSGNSTQIGYNEINHNFIYNNDIGLNSSADEEVNATYNWWGSCDGPSGIGSGTGDSVYGNVDYEPWIIKGVCITNKTNVTCAFETKNVTLSADLNGTEINSIWFSYTINNTNYNKTASHIGGNKYQAVIPSNELIGGQNITWNVYANDSIKTYKNGEKTFYVRKKTKLSVNGTFGLNGWYVTEPLFTLIKDTLGGNNYYQWDSTGALLYTAPFGLENIPNPPEESAGTLELNWWTDFGVVCGNESKQSKMFYIDLTNPLITNLKPTNNSVVYNNLKPEISAYLDEVYGSNSGIDTEIVQMSLNGNPVPAIVNLTDTLDAIITYIPISNLNLGKHNVSVNVTDNAGRNSELTWFFYINITPVFTMQVNSPQSKIYDSKRIPFNITLSENVEKIEYMNLDDKTPRWRNLCRNCNEYGFVREKTKTLKEGWNNITIKATDFFGQSKEENRSLFIDSKEPRIHRTEPRRNSVVNGSEFYIKYTEDNLKNITLFWNPNKTLNCSSGKNQECTTNANLSSYNGQWIEYWFEVSDSINKVSSSETRVFVDTTPPELNVSSPKNLVNGTYGRKVLFNITVSEPVLLEYYDNSVASPRWRTLCARCSEYGNSRAKTQAFSRGEHNIQIRAVDEAGNSDVEERSFEVEY